jgi:hypothetical protein
MAIPLRSGQQSRQSFSGRHFVDLPFPVPIYTKSPIRLSSPSLRYLTYMSNVLRYQLTHLAPMIYMVIHHFRTDSA